MAFTPAERERLIEQYASGAARLRIALGRAPVDARQWHPTPGEWSVHEVVCHCADAETTAASRIRVLLVEHEPFVVGYDQDAWATRLDYQAQPLQEALAVVEAVRAHTATLLRRLPPEAWSRVGRHSESGRYTAEDWLRTSAQHLEGHARQIEANGAAWETQSITGLA